MIVEVMKFIQYIKRMFSSDPDFVRLKPPVVSDKSEFLIVNEHKNGKISVKHESTQYYLYVDIHGILHNAKWEHLIEKDQLPFIIKKHKMQLEEREGLEVSSTKKINIYDNDLLL